MSEDGANVPPRLTRLVSEIGRDGTVLVESRSAGDDDLVMVLTGGYSDRVGVPAPECNSVVHGGSAEDELRDDHARARLEPSEFAWRAKSCGEAPNQQVEIALHRCWQ